MTEQISLSSESHFYPLDEDPSLTELATTDEQLALLIGGVKRTREFVGRQPDNLVLADLAAAAEETTEAYLQQQGFGRMIDLRDSSAQG